ncbi:MAG: LysM peptidoglycan-binding domain-containing protein [Lentisphaeria bacterium]|nr:LysM peptidoglycan-binding domain-containing protein [Lentisphaeria bacterium]
MMAPAKKCVMVVLFSGLAVSAQQSQPASAYDVARLKAGLQQVIEEHDRIVGLLEQNKQVTEAIIQRLQAVEEKSAANAAQSRTGLATKADVQALQNQIAQERKARELAMAELIRSVSQEISRVGGGGQTGGGTTGGAVSAGATQGVYTVVAGDTLSTIAKAFGVSVTALKQANNLTDDMIRVNQKLTIPAP